MNFSFVTMTDTITSENISFSAWIILYIPIAVTLILLYVAQYVYVSYCFHNEYSTYKILTNCFL
jgi:hypothetical protein